MKVQLHTFLTSTPEEGEQSVSRSGYLTPRQSPRYLLNMRLDGPSASLDALDKKRVYFPAGNQTTLSACPVRILAITPTEIHKLFVDTIIWKDVILEVTVTAVIGQNSKILLTYLFQRHRIEVNLKLHLILVTNFERYGTEYVDSRFFGNIIFLAFVFIITQKYTIRAVLNKCLATATEDFEFHTSYL